MEKLILVLCAILGMGCVEGKFNNPFGNNSTGMGISVVNLENTENISCTGVVISPTYIMSTKECGKIAMRIVELPEQTIESVRVRSSENGLSILVVGSTNPIPAINASDYEPESTDPVSLVGYDCEGGFISISTTFNEVENLAGCQLVDGNVVYDRDGKVSNVIVTKTMVSIENLFDLFDSYRVL